MTKPAPFTMVVEEQPWPLQSTYTITTPDGTWTFKGTGKDKVSIKYTYQHNLTWPFSTSGGKFPTDRGYTCTLERLEAALEFICERAIRPDTSGFKITEVKVRP